MSVLWVRASPPLWRRSARPTNQISARSRHVGEPRVELHLLSTCPVNVFISLQRCVSDLRCSLYLAYRTRWPTRSRRYVA